jgi:hypothetical protein
MKNLLARSTVLPLVASVLLAACADSSATAPRVLATAPSAAVVGAPNLSDFNSFAGELLSARYAWGGTGFYFNWRIVDNATNLVVASGRSRMSAQQCLLLGTVPTNVSGRYTATVKEDPASRTRCRASLRRTAATSPTSRPRRRSNSPSSAFRRS